MYLFRQELLTMRDSRQPTKRQSCLGRQTKKRKRKKKHDDYIASSFNFSSTDNNKNKSKEEGKKKETNRGPHFIDSKLNEIITSENIANNILCIPSNFDPLFDIVINNIL